MTEDDHDHDHEDEETHAHDDEHVWLSLINAQVLTAAIAEELMALNPDCADDYAANLDAYVAELSALDAQYAETVANAATDVILVADRFPFLYLVSDYNLSYYAAFSGCSAETEASFETIIFLATKVDELGLNTILTIENPQHQIAQTVSNATQAKSQTILELNSMQSTTVNDVESGITYYSTMESNLAVLAEALG